MNVLPNIGTEAQMVLLKFAADGQSEQRDVQPVIRQNIQNIWHVHNCIEQNTLLNVRLGLQFIIRFAGAASEYATIQLRNVTQTERLVSMITKGAKVVLEKSAPPSLIHGTFPRAETVLPQKSEAPAPILPQKVWTSRHTTQLLTYLEQTVAQATPAPAMQGKSAAKEVPTPASPKQLSQKAENGTSQKPKKAEIAIPQTIEEAAPTRKEQSTPGREEKGPSAHIHRVNILPQSMQLISRASLLGGISQAALQRQSVQQAVSPVQPQLFTPSSLEPLAVTPPDLTRQAAVFPQAGQERQPSKVSKIISQPAQPFRTTQTPQAQTPTEKSPLAKTPVTQPEGSFAPQSLVHAQTSPSGDDTPTKQTTQKPQELGKPTKAEAPQQTLSVKRAPFVPKKTEEKEGQPLPARQQPTAVSVSEAMLPPAMRLHAEPAASRPMPSEITGGATAPNFRTISMTQGISPLVQISRTQPLRPYAPVSAAPAQPASTASKRAGEGNRQPLPARQQPTTPVSKAMLPPAMRLHAEQAAFQSAPSTTSGETVPPNFLPVTMTRGISTFNPLAPTSQAQPSQPFALTSPTQWLSAAPKRAEKQARQPLPARQQPTTPVSEAFLPPAMRLHAEQTAAQSTPSEIAGENAPHFRPISMTQGIPTISPLVQAPKAQLPQPFQPASTTFMTPSTASVRAQAAPPQTLLPAAPMVPNTGNVSSAFSLGGEATFASASFTPVQAVHRAAMQSPSSRAEDDDSLDIPTIIQSAKTVQGETKTETVTNNISINAPQTITTSANQQAAMEAVALHIESEVNRLSDAIYRKLEQRFRSEKMRRGLW